MGNPAKQQELKGTVTVFSNSPGVATGYGQQTEYLVESMQRHKLDVAVQSNYGVEGKDRESKTKHGKLIEFARGLTPYSDDVVFDNHMMFASRFPDQNELLVTLYDAWVFQNPKFNEFRRILAWTPLDHMTMPPNVFAFLKRENVLPIAMSPFGLRQMQENNIEGIYIPHGIDTKVFIPTEGLNGVKTRKFLGVPEDAFLVMMNSANKANKSIHRKAFAENMLAFKLHREKYPNSYLYIHTEPRGVFGGFDLMKLAKTMGIPQEAILFPQPDDYRRGFTREQLAALYTAADVTLTTSYGEGFGIGTIESQACGTPTITSAFAASQDLAGEDSYLIPGQPLWDEAQGAWFAIPNINAIVDALEQAQNARTGEKSVQSIQFAKAFDFEAIWLDKWLPLLKSELA